MISVRHSTHIDTAFQTFCDQLNKEFRVRYPGSQHNFEPYNTVNDTSRVVIAYAGDIPAGCGCFRPTEEKGTIEIKRMYVREDFRGLGIAKIVLIELEKWAVTEGFTHSKLETGVKQPEAIALYTRNGYQQIPNYPPYVGVDLSICMIKKLVQPGAAQKLDR